MINNRSESIFKAIGLTSKLLSLYIHDKFYEHEIELTRPQFVLLKVLSEKDGSSQKELAFVTERDKTSLTRLITSMENKGYVIRKADKNDGRKRLIFLTQEGHTILDIAEPIMLKIEAELTNKLESESLETTKLTLNKIQSKILSS